VERHHGPSDGDGVGTRVLPQRHDGEERDDTDGDDGAFWRLTTGNSV
jgi:hypothetical protein